LPDSTHPPRRRAIAWWACLALLAGVPAALPVTARADGDPASDVLATQPVFLPQDGGITALQQSQLTSLVASAQRAGYPLRVVVVATRSDLGSVTALWRRPASYARFLAQELSQVTHGTLLVVMPDGFGLARIGSAGSVPPDPLRGLPAPGSGRALGSAAISAVRRLAAAAGHRLPTPSSGAQPRAPTASPGTGPVAWLAFAVGAILIVGAWTASLRVRPWRRPDGVGSPHGS
jgi:hypothetical protein